MRLIAPCITGWTFEAGTTIEIARLAVETGLWPLLEWVDGELVDVKKIRRPKPVEDYLKIQGRYKHLFKKPDGTSVIKDIQSMADANIAKYNLVD